MLLMERSKLSSLLLVILLLGSLVQGYLQVFLIPSMNVFFEVGFVFKKYHVTLQE